jgi:hypothetical protein
MMPIHHPAGAPPAGGRVHWDDAGATNGVLLRAGLNPTRSIIMRAA